MAVSTVNETERGTVLTQEAISLVLAQGSSSINPDASSRNSTVERVEGELERSSCGKRRVACESSVPRSPRRGQIAVRSINTAAVPTRPQ